MHEINLEIIDEDTIRVYGFMNRVGNLKECLAKTILSTKLFGGGDWKYGYACCGDITNEYGRYIYTDDDEDREGATREFITNHKVHFTMYVTPEECTLEKAKEYCLRNILGDMVVEGSDYWISEITYDETNIEKLTIGGHDITKMIQGHGDKYFNIIITTKQFPIF